MKGSGHRGLEGAAHLSFRLGDLGVVVCILFKALRNSEVKNSFFKPNVFLLFVQ